MKRDDQLKREELQRVGTSLARRPSRDLLPKQSSLKKHATGLSALLEAKREDRLQLVHKLASERDPGIRSLLKQRISYLRENERLAAGLLEQLKAMEPHFKLQFELLNNGRHPHEDLLRTVAQRESKNFSDAEMFQDRETFVLVLLKLLYEYPFLQSELKERDRKYRTEFTRYRRGVHDRQAAIEELARQRGFASPSGGGEDNFRMFVSLAKDKWLLRRIEKGLAENSLAELLEQTEKRAAAAERRAGEIETIRTETSERLRISESKRVSIEARLSREEAERRRQEQEAQRLDRQARNFKSRLKSTEKELDEERTGQARELKRITDFRQEVLQRVELFLEQEEVRIKARGRGMRLPPDDGFLMLETERVLAAEVANGEWPASTNYYFLMVLRKHLEPDTFEERYYHQAGRNIVRALTSYLLGYQPLASALQALKSANLSSTLLAPLLVHSPTGDWARDLLEAWIRPQRDFQSAEFPLYQKERHPLQDKIDFNLQREDLPRPEDLQSWLDLWDRYPEWFTDSLDKQVRGEHG